MRALLAVVALLTTAAPAAADPQTDLDAARTAWAERKLDDYDFRIARSCFCPPNATRPRDVEVRDGKPVRGAKGVRRYATVPRIFAVIQDAIDREAERVQVRYGPGGFPRDVYIDYSFMIADEELGLTVRKVRPRR